MLANVVAALSAVKPNGLCTNDFSNQPPGNLGDVTLRVIFGSTVLLNRSPSGLGTDSVDLAAGAGSAGAEDRRPRSLSRSVR